MSKDSESAKTKSKNVKTSKVAITLHGQEYMVACDEGDEKKLAEIVRFVNNKLEEVAANNQAASDMRLFMLTCLFVADELIETRKAAEQSRKEDESLMVAAVDHLRERVQSIATMVAKA